MLVAHHHADGRREVSWHTSKQRNGFADTVRYLFSEKRTIEEVQGYCNSNAKDIIAIGFDPAKTFIFSDVRGEKQSLLATQEADQPAV